MAMCGEQYIHTLIPDRVDFAPQPYLITSFFDKLGALGAAPVRAELVVITLSGGLRTGRNPVTGDLVSIPDRKRLAVETITEIPKAIGGLDHYDVRMLGEGPPLVPPFQLLQGGDSAIVEFGPENPYGFDVACCLRAQPVSTSCWEDSGSPHNPPLFGEPSSLEDRTGFFARPPDAALLTVPNAGTARFWIEFEFGKWIFPKIENSFDVLNPRIMTCAEQVFGSKFAQGCHWS